MKLDDSVRIDWVAAGPCRWFQRVGIAALAVAMFLGCQRVTADLVGQAHWNILWMVAAQGIAGAALLLLAMWEYRQLGSIKALFGHDLLHTLQLTAPLVVAVYLLMTFVEAGLGHGPGSFMLKATAGLSAIQITLFFGMLIVFPAISEELLYRHFLIRLFPLNLRASQEIAVMVTAVLFMQAHGQYQHWTSYALMGCLGVILGLARIISGGMTAPVLLHGLATVMGITSDLFLNCIE